MAERMAASMYHFILRKKKKKRKYKKQYYKVAAQKQRGSYVVYRTDLRRMTLLPLEECISELHVILQDFFREHFALREMQVMNWFWCLYTTMG